MRPYFAAATAVVLPSYREGLPRSLLGAGAMACPLIATDVAGCWEVVVDDENGYLCRVSKPTSLASAMRCLSELPDETLVALGSAARHKVEDQLSKALVTTANLETLAAVDAVTLAC